VELLGRSADTPLAEVLHELGPVLTSLRADAARIDALGRASELLRRVIGHRLEPLVARAFERLDGRDRKAMIGQVEAVAAELRGAGVGTVITAQRFVSWTVPVLERDELVPSGQPAVIIHRREYDEVCASEPALSITDTLVAVVLATLPPESLAPESPGAAAEAVRDVLRDLDEDLRERVVALDLARVQRRIERLESWWRSMTVATEGEGSEVDARLGLLEAVVRSGWLRAMRGDAEPLRLVTELGHLVEVFPDCGPRGARLRKRLEELDASSTRALVTRLEDRSDRAWSEALSGGRDGASGGSEAR
jgi:hypothetical protein